MNTDLCRRTFLAGLVPGAALLSASGLQRIAIIPLAAETHHVQGVEILDGTAWVTSVDRPSRRGFLYAFSLKDGRLLRTQELQQGDRYHPGGLSAEGRSLWIPVAEYTRTGTSLIQRRSAATLRNEAEFAVDDHIGAVAVTPEGILGANWDARMFYLWDRSGKLLRKTPNPSDVRCQDMKFTNGTLLTAGLLPDKSGMLEWVEWPGLRSLRRVPAGNTDRGVALTHEGMAVRGNRLYLLPEDSPSRLFIYRLP